MKTYTKTIWNICACMLIILLGGCADDDIIRNDCGSTLQETESHLISTFSLPEGKTPIQDTREQIFFQLRSLSDNSIQSLNLSATNWNGTHRKLLDVWRLIKVMGRKDHLGLPQSKID